jgi:predicted metal-binding membrane protein
MIYDVKDCARLRNGVLLASATAWVVLLARPEESCHGPASSFGASLRGSVEALESRASGWLVMLVAMMAPMTLGALYQVRLRSFVRRRWRASTLVVAGYGMVWMAAGVALTAIELAVLGLAPASPVPAIVVATVACIWQASPLKQRALNRCHAHRAARAFGLAADWDALRIGLEHGVWCVGSCWAVMLLPLLLPRWHLAAMAAVTLLMFCERLDRPEPPVWRLRGFHTAFRLVRMRLFGPRSSPPPYTTTAAT